jgi:ProP effector
MRQQFPAREHDRAALADPSARLIVELVDTADHEQAIMATLAERWPLAFSIYEKRRKPLKIGIDQDIAAALGGAVTPAELTSALRLYVGNLGYLLACREGVERVDLNGAPSGTVTAAEAAYAARIVARRQRKVAAEPNAAKPATAAPPRLGLVDLKRAALVRKAAAS